MKKIILIFLIINSSVVAQNCIANKKSISIIKADIEYLSDDKLEGREVGTKGEELALKYLQKRFKEIGLKTIVHEFEFNTLTKIKFSGNREEFYGTQYSSSGEIRKAEIIDAKFGIYSTELKHDDYKGLDVKGKAVLIDISSPDGVHPHSKFRNYTDLKARAEIAKIKGASCVIFHTEDNNIEKPKQKFKKLNSVGIPVLFLMKEKQKILTKKISFKIDLKENSLTGKNLIAEIDNNKENTIVIGAHYDHLGWGEEGSLYTGEPAIHNGADDNASGTAALLELAKFYQNASYTNYNYKFIAFSGEEKGLLGSSAYVKNNFDAEKINYMINMDMIGRLNNEGRIEIYGTGTSPRWENLLKENICKEIKIKTSSSGIGPSDHTSFYLKDIPVLHFFTGTHSDYHKPTDDASKINFKGIGIITAYIKGLINDLDDENKLEFSKTKHNPALSTPKFSVTLGVIPDYLYSDKGMRINGIIDGRPAQKAKIKEGDIVIQLGNVKVIDMTTYMKALAALNKGDKAKIIVLREEERIQLEVEF